MKRWTRRTTPSPALRLTPAEQATAQARALLTTKAEQLEAITEETLETCRETLAHQWTWTVTETSATLAMQVRQHGQNVASMVLSPRLRKLLRRQMTPGDLEVRHRDGTAAETEAVARQALMTLHPGRLWSAVVGVALALPLVGLLDVLLVQRIAHDAAVDPLTGQLPPEHAWPILAMALATVVGYTLTGLLWHWPVLRPLSGLLYAVIAWWLAMHLAGTIPGDLAPGLWWASLGVWTVLYTLPGVLLMLGEGALVWLVGLLRDWYQARRVVAEAEAGHVDTLHLTLLTQQQGDKRAIPLGVDQALRLALSDVGRIWHRIAEIAGVRRQDLSLSEDERDRAAARHAQALRCLEQLKGLSLAALLTLLTLVRPGQAAGPATREAILAQGKAIVIAVDVSGSSPVAHAAWLAGVLPQIAEDIRSAEIGATITVFGCGDNTQVPEEGRIILQHRDTATGRTKDRALAWVQARLDRLRTTVTQHGHQASELVGCFAEATRRLNPRAVGNSLLFLTDGIERSDKTDCFLKPCKLPDVPVTLPPGTQVLIRGCGIGVPAAKAMELQAQWLAFVRRVGGSKVLVQVRS